jgi:predicted nuclease of predicted toxin-antitoxin system
VARFLLDENLPARAADLLSAFEYPFVAVGPGIAELPRGTSDVEIANWCGANGAVWVTLDLGILKDQAIVTAIAAAGTSVLLLPSKGVNARDHLRFLVCRYEVIEQRVREAERRGRPFRARLQKRGSIQDISI